MGGQRNNSGKRRSDYSDGGGGKRRNSGDDRSRDRDRDRYREREGPGYTPDPDDTVYRYLCPGKKIGSILGRGGEIAKQLRSDTRAKIRIGETVSGCDERVITIWSNRKETNNSDETGELVCPAQDALFKVHDKIVVDDMSVGEEGEAGGNHATARLLVPSDQIGCVIGKAGSIVQAIRSDTGAQIRIMKDEHMPACALPSDELIQIVGDPGVVKKALIRVASQLHENPSRSNSLVTQNGPLPAPIISPYGGYDRDHRGADWASFYPLPRDEHSSREFTLRLVCRSSLIGAVIGKNGSVINQIRQESGATVKVDSEAIEDDCIISISAKEYFEDLSPTIDAAVRLQPKCSERTESGTSDVLTTRLLVSSSRIGCLIGKGGSIVTEMRRSTRANIRILSKDNLPKVATLDDEMVQISGEADVAKNALVEVAMRLKANFFERENELSHFPSIPYQQGRSHSPEPSRYSRDGRYSGSHGIYGSSGDIGSYGRYGGSHGGGSSYGTYGGYSGRSGSSGPGSHGRYH
ncbi:hypothetical protein LUZ61_006397 [Rhynchospora tenuis]|uniref:K Homology domain-containing protein n=1 Tax=Rhynchospora tenuis TaxID=198213 RepID=A0AAD5ZRE3_9POAL|nr:hypothetical protein LUZ61_006397 [Rhynchospora tenuis]